MSELLPSNTTIGDLCTAALQDCGRLGTGQTALAEDMNKAWARCQWMLQEWERKRWLVYHLVTYSKVATGQVSYTFGPGGELNTNSVPAWGLSSLSQVAGGLGYLVGDKVVLTPVPASGTPVGALAVQVTSVGAGGVVTGVTLSVGARGTLTFVGNPNPGDTVTLNGVVWTFVAGAPVGNQVQIAGTLVLTLAAAALAWNGSTNAQVALATYYGVTAGNAITVVYDTGGTAGNTYTLAASAAAVSGATLAGGSLAGDTIYPGPLPESWTQLSSTGVGLGMTAGLPTWGLSTTQVVQSGSSVRPAKIESAFVRQIINGGSPVDFDMRILQSMEDYNRIALKSMSGFPGAVFLDASWPLANMYWWPVPQSGLYSVNVTVLEQLPTSFLSLATPVNLPREYYSAILYNLALRLRIPFSIPTFPGDPLPGMAKNSLNVLRGANTAIAALQMPGALRRDGGYNIFSDQGA